MEGGTFSKKSFSWGGEGGIYWEIDLHWGTNDQNMPRGKEFHQMHFPVIGTLLISKFFPDLYKIFP